MYYNMPKYRIPKDFTIFIISIRGLSFIIFLDLLVSSFSGAVITEEVISFLEGLV